MRPDPDLPNQPPIPLGLGLIAIGLGLVAMTAGRLPGIAVTLEAPRWLMGGLGGLLVGYGLLAARLLPRRLRFGTSSRTAVMGAAAVLGLVFGLSNQEILATPFADALNLAGRVLFPTGVGVLIGWAATALPNGPSR